MNEKSLWLRREPTIALIGRSDEYLRTEIVPRLADGHARQTSGRGKPWEFYSPGVVAVFVGLIDTTGDPLLTDGDSPALERYRRAKACLAELQVAQQIGELVPREFAYQHWSAFCGHLRRFSVNLQRRFGRDAHESFVAAVNDCQRIIDRAVGPGGCGGSLTIDVPGDEQKQITIRFPQFLQKDDDHGKEITNEPTSSYASDE